MRGGRNGFGRENRTRTAEAESGPLERPQPPLVGRDRELADLYALIDGIEERGGALVVRGEAGIGKSALLAAASNPARRRGVAGMAARGGRAGERGAVVWGPPVLCPGPAPLS